MPTPANINIRPAISADLAWIQRLMRRWGDNVGYLPAPAVERYINARHVAILENAAGPAAYAITRPELSDCPVIRPILQIAVDKSSIARGHGAALLEHVLTRATAEHIAVVQLWCRDAIPARAFWPRHGFIAIASRPAGTSRGGTVTLWARQTGPISPAALLLRKPARQHGPGGVFTKTPRHITPLIDPRHVPEIAA